MATAPRTDAATLPVRPGEEPWTGFELAEVRDALEAEAAGLRRDIEEAESHIADRLGDGIREAGDDEADVGVKTFEREHEFQMTSNARRLLEQTEQALSRIDAGTYGVCGSCGQPIGKARLMAFPRAVLCVRCKQREERR
jgi:DnaK suppressor protein